MQPIILTFGTPVHLDQVSPGTPGAAITCASHFRVGNWTNKGGRDCVKN